MATEIADMQLVPLFQFFQYYVYSLNRIDRSFLTYQDRKVHTYWIDSLVTFRNVSLQLWVDADSPFLSCLVFYDSKLTYIRDCRKKNKTL